MRQLNLIIVLDVQEEHVLMCLRQKPPYVGRLNFVGGKVERNETLIDSCYRELFEETGIHASQIELTPLMSFYYKAQGIQLFVAWGCLKEMVDLTPEKNPLQWVSLKENFKDLSKFAGNGNIQIMLETLSILRSEL